MIAEILSFPPLLLLIGAAAFIAPAIIIRSRMSSFRIWTWGLAAIWAGHLLVSVNILGAPPYLMALTELWHPIFIGPLLVVTLPLIAFLPESVLVLATPPIAWLLLLLNSALWAIPVAGLCVLRKRKLEREEQERRDKIEAAIDKIEADGVVEGPKGPYVPHRKWHHRSIQNNGYYGSG